MEINDNPETTASTLWETAKVVMRGKIISYHSYKNKKERKMESDLHKEVKRLELLAASTPNEISNMKELLSKKHELNNIINKKTVSVRVDFE